MLYNSNYFMKKFKNYFLFKESKEMKCDEIEIKIMEIILQFIIIFTK